jgi:hypothetical protein
MFLNGLSCRDLLTYKTDRRMLCSLPRIVLTQKGVSNVALTVLLLVSGQGHLTLTAITIQSV